MSSRDWAEKDFYAVLGVAKNASTDEIKKAYRKLARESHPDRNPGDAQAEERFKAASEAYGVLSDERQREEYDEMRSLLGSGAFRRTARTGGGVPFDFSDLFSGASAATPGRFGGAAGGSSGGFSDLFSSLFTGTGGASRRTGVRGRDVETEVVLGFVEAVQGVTLPLTLRAPGACETCKGTGAKAGTQPSTCPACRGQGLVTSNQGAFSFSEPCVDCRGVGTIIEEKCLDCHGTGTVTKTRTLNVRIPPGVNDGQRIRLAGRGEPGDRGGPSGDLNVLIKVRKDELFGREGLDLTITLPVTYPEAVFGADLRVPTLDSAVTVRVPPGTPSGRTLRVRGRGVRRVDGRTGDLLVTIELHVPAKLSSAARRTLEEHAAAGPPAPRTRLDAVAGERDGSAAAASTAKGRRDRDDR
ncbi:MAG: molecular chaperone DnaJ [Dactylosporangium sp.]|nr:molecular chaperone DnaJ [Dactylosporangium sp.]NNJ62745.1 molecular chaperone DnaJ [Dactylosporangium sp.]